MKIASFLPALVLAITATCANAADLTPPDAVVKQTVDKILATFNEDKDIIHNHEKMENMVATTVLPRFDFAYITQLTIGEKNWSAASPQDQANLVDEYRAFLAQLFSKSLAQYEGETVTYTSSELSSDANKAIVKSQLISAADEPAEMDFRLNKTTEGWMVYDIDIGGVDLIKTYKSNFKSVLENGGVANLTSELHKKNQQVKSAKKE
jgi:phospholipid transport system substrate-binding protein